MNDDWVWGRNWTRDRTCPCLTLCTDKKEKSWCYVAEGCPYQGLSAFGKKWNWCDPRDRAQEKVDALRRWFCNNRHGTCIHRPWDGLEASGQVARHECEQDCKVSPPPFSVLTVLVVCSSPLGRDYPKQIPLIQKTLGEHKLEFIFLDGVHDFGWGKTFPGDLQDFKLDVIWFSGCNVLTWIFDPKNTEEWRRLFVFKLKPGGIVFFTEALRYITKFCESGTPTLPLRTSKWVSKKKIQKRRRPRLPPRVNASQIFIDITCYAEHPLAEKGKVKEQIKLFLNLFRKNQNGNFIYYSKKNVSSV